MLRMREQPSSLIHLVLFCRQGMFSFRNDCNWAQILVIVVGEIADYAWKAHLNVSKTMMVLREFLEVSNSLTIYASHSLL